MLLLLRLHRPDLVPRGAIIATYSQWRTSPEVGERRVTYVCGDQPVLVEEVVDHTRAAVSQRFGTDPEFVSLSRSSTFDTDVWAEAFQSPLTPGQPRLVVVRDAEHLKRWDKLHLWMGFRRRMPGIFLVFVSGQPDVPKAGGKVVAHLAIIKAPAGFLVRATAPKDDDAIAFARRRAPGLDADMAAYLLDRAGGELITVASACAKISLFNGKVGPTTIDALCAERPADNFVNHLVASQKRQALQCLPDLDDRSLGVLHRLGNLIDLLARLHRIQISGQSWRDAGVDSFQARLYLPYARDYDLRRCVYRRRVLAVVEDALLQGATTGVMEGLVALW